MWNLLFRRRLHRGCDALGLPAVNAPVYVGFGSVQIRDPARLAGMLIEAARAAGQR